MHLPKQRHFMQEVFFWFNNEVNTTKHKYVPHFLNISLLIIHKYTKTKTCELEPQHHFIPHTHVQWLVSL